MCTLKTTRNWSLGALVALGLSAAMPTAANTLRADAAAVGAGGYLATVALATVTERHTDHSIEVTADQNGARSMVSMGRGQIDMVALILAQYTDMLERVGAFADLADGPEAAKAMRSIFAFPGGAYHFVVWDEQGVKSLQELRGKRFFLGPRNSAAERFGVEMIRGETGFEPGKDYELLNLDFRGGEQAFQDRQIDLYMRTATVGGSIIEQLGVTNKIRLLGLTDVGRNNPDMLRIIELPGRGFSTIAPGIYTGQVNEEPVVTMGFSLGMGVHMSVDEQTIYDLTRAFVENLEEFVATAPGHFTPVTRDTLFDELNVPLHIGAYRYFKDVGIEVPEALVPPEAM